jgi:hypothetical protein
MRFHSQDRLRTKIGLQIGIIGVSGPMPLTKAMQLVFMLL